MPIRDEQEITSMLERVANTRLRLEEMLSEFARRGRPINAGAYATCQRALLALQGMEPALHWTLGVSEEDIPPEQCSLGAWLDKAEKFVSEGFEEANRRIVCPPR